MFVHEDLVCSEGDQGSSRHGIMGDNYRHLCRMIIQGLGYLFRCKEKSAWCMDYQVYGRIIGGHTYSP